MFDVIFQYIFPILVNLYEVWLFFYLYRRKLDFRPNSQRLTFICFIANVALISIKPYFSLSTLENFLFVFILDILIACMLGTTPFTSRLFWGCIPTFISSLADALTLQVGGITTHYSPVELLTAYPISNLMTLVYLFFSSACVFLLTRIGKKSLVFPQWLEFIFLALIFLGIISIESMLDLLLSLNPQDNMKKNILYFSVSTILIIFITLIFLIYYLGNLYQRYLDLEKENQQKMIEQQQYELLSQTTEAMRTFRHDLHHHIAVLQIMTQKQNVPELESYLSSMQQEITGKGWCIQTGNNTMDAVISSKYYSMKKYNIHFTHSIFLPAQFPLPDLELTSVIGNLLDNAIESCCKSSPEQERWIDLKIKPYQQNLLIKLNNSSYGNYRFNALHHLLTSKPEAEHGIGLRHVEEIIRNANGFIHINPQDTIFSVDIILPLLDELENTQSFKKETY